MAKKHQCCIYVLAAGSAQRFGDCKQLASLGGRPLAMYALETAVRACMAIQGDDVQAECSVVVVLGAHEQRIKECLSLEMSANPQVFGQVKVVFLYNDAYEQGQATSVKLAAKTALAAGVDVAVFLTADMPFVRVVHVAELARSVNSSPACHAAAADYGFRFGVPCAFDATWLEQLTTLTGDRGAGYLLNKTYGKGSQFAPENLLAWKEDAEFVVVPFASEKERFDVDTVSDLNLACSLLEKSEDR